MTDKPEIDFPSGPAPTELTIEDIVVGRRKLTIPPEQAYGRTGSGHRLSGKTLIFVIDLLGTG